MLFNGLEAVSAHAVWQRSTHNQYLRWMRGHNISADVRIYDMIGKGL